MAVDRADVDEPVQAHERFLFQGQSASGYARQHNGNVYNSTLTALTHMEWHANPPDYAYTYTVRKRRSDETLQEGQRNGQLLKAAAAGHTPRARYLLQLGADRDFSDDEKGFTALHHAALSGFEDTVQLLLDEGIDVAAQALDLGTPLHVAALKGRVNVLNLLLKFRADPNAESHAVGRPLHCACAAGDLETVSALLANSADVNANVTFDFRPLDPSLVAGSRHWLTRSWKCQPLFVATSLSAKNIVLKLLDVGAAIDRKAHARPISNVSLRSSEKALLPEPFSEAGANPLLASVMNNALDITRMLLGRGAFGKDDVAAVTWAAREGRRHGLELLLEHVPSPDSEDGVIGTPLMAAVIGGHVDLARYLLDVGASINFLTSPKFGSSALHNAVHFNQLEMVNRLLDWGADRASTDAKGQTAADVARSRRDLRP